MATVEEVVRDVLASVKTSAGGLLVAKWVDNRYREMVSKIRFRHLRQLGELSLPAVIDNGTVAVTRGSTTVTGALTTFETDMSAGTQEYYYFRTRTAWYKIASVTNDNVLTLASAFAEDSVSAGSYHIVKRIHPLASDARWMGDFYLARLHHTLESVSLTELDIMFPGRPFVGNIPDYIAQIAVNSSNYLTVEIYPPPEKGEIIHYTYWALPTSLTITSTIPAVIDSYTLKEGVLVDLYRHEKTKAATAEMFASWRNEERTQETKWRGFINDAIRTSRGNDDISIILKLPNVQQQNPRDQRTARDYVYANWSR